MRDDKMRKEMDGISRREGQGSSKQGKIFYKSAMVGTMKMDASDVRALDRGWSWAVVVGILMIILGAVAIVYPALTTVGFVFLIGAVLVIGSIVQLIHAFSVRSWKGFFWHLLLAATYAIAGILLLTYPLGGLITLTFVLAMYFLLSGLFKIILSVTSRRSTTNWGWMLFSGILALVLGVLVWMAWPYDSLWFIGLLVGIDLVIGGFSLAAMGVSAHEMAQEEI